MQETEEMRRMDGVSEVARFTLGIILFVLLIGLWVYLWVPSSLAF